MKRTRDNSARGQGVGIAILTARAITFCLAAFAAAMFCSCTTMPKTVCRAYVPDTDHIDVHGNVYLDRYPSGLLHEAFDNGDTAVATMLGRTYRLTVVSDIRAVSPGTAVLHFHPEKPPYDRMAVVNGSFAAKAGIARQVPVEDGKKPIWKPEEGVEFPVEIRIARVGKTVRQPSFNHYAGRSNKRTDYQSLTDAEFANFRAVSAPSIASGTLYRSSSPIDPSLGRSRFADAAAASCGVKSVWDMADTADDAAAYAGFDQTYCRNNCKIRFGTPLGTDFNSGLFKAGVLGGLLFISESEPPFLIHCKEGRDRTGLVAMLIEALCGATRAEMEADYVKSFENYAIGEFDRGKVAESFAYCMKALGLEGVPDAELSARAWKYLRGIGMEDHEIKALLENLAKATPRG